MARSPLFDIYDPYGALAQQAQFGLLPSDDEDIDPIGLVPIRRKPTISDLMPEEEKTGLLRSLANMGSSGMAGLGWLLDIPGAIVRGGLSGGLGKAASALWETSDDRVTGRELLRQYGMVGQEDTWGNFGASLAAEVLLDPLTYANPLAILGRGAYTQAGKALRDSGRLRNAAVDAYRGFDPNLAQAAAGAAQRDAGQGVRSYLRGQTPRQVLAEAPNYQDALQAWQRNAARYGVDPNDLDQPLARLMDVRIPGTNIGFSTDVFGEAFGDAVAGGLDTFGEWTKRAPGIGPVTRGAAMLFHSPSGFVMDPDRQWNARIAAADAEQLTANRMRERARQQLNALQAQVPDSAMINGVQTAIPEELRRFDSARIQQAMGDYAESQPDLGPNFIGPLLPRTSGDAVADWVMENTPAFREIRDSFVDLGPAAAAQAEALGLPAPVFRSREGVGWIPRQLRWWERPAPPVRPGVDSYRERPWSRGSRVLNTADNFGRRRQDYTDIAGGQQTFRALTGGTDQLDAAALQVGLQASTPRESRRLVDQAFRTLGMDTPYRRIAYDVMGSDAYRAAAPAERVGMLREAVASIRENKEDLAEFLRRMDTNFARTGTGAYDTPTWTNVLRYEAGRDRVTANTEQVIQELLRGAHNVPQPAIRGGGALTLQQAAERLGFDATNFRQMWQGRTGQDVTNYSIDERLVESLRSLATPSRASDAERGLLRGIDNFTNAFKVGALASPAFHIRNLYSGAINAATQGAFNPLDAWAALRASSGNYEALARRLRNAPGYENMTDAERVNRFLAETGAQRIGGGTLFDDISGLPEQEMRGLFTGANTGQPSLASTFFDRNRSWPEWADQFFSMRGVGITSAPRSRNTNPILALNDAAGQSVEDALRTGTFLNQVRRGIDPAQAGDIARLTQVDYSPAAFTPFERNFMKRVMPFYSFQKGILPSVADNLLYRPGSLMGQSVRAVTRGSEPSENNFVPEYLRQSAAIPLPADLPWIFGGSSKEGLQRYLTNIDLPWESTFQMFTPGIGATTASTLADTIQKTGSNVLGQTSPLIKAPLEYITNRQLYSGRDLSDLFSVLERDVGEVGRPLEQAIVNFVPFGSRSLGLYRQLTDTRLDPADRYTKAAWNLLAGAKLTDVDQERTKRLAARQVLNNLLETTPGVRTYENVTVPEDVLRSMPREQQQMYLLYKIIQSEASKRAREKKKQEAALDPLQVLGVVNQF
jgi:hypothetical protein